MTHHQTSEYCPAADRYGRATWRRCGASGLKLPPISLGLWQNFGAGSRIDEDAQRSIVRRAFDRGVTHFDLANNYGPPPGSAEEFFGAVLASDFRAHRDELIVSTKAGYDMWPGPYGSVGGSRKYLVASLDQSLARMGLDYVDIFYHHRWVEDDPLEETMMALDQIVRQGKALYVGVSSYNALQTRRAQRIARELGTPLVIHQPSYSMLNRWIEEPVGEGDDETTLVETCPELGMGMIAFSPLGQGMLTNRYLNGVPQGSRASERGSLRPEQLTEQTLGVVRDLHDLAQQRGQELAAMALQWALREDWMTSVIIGASSVEQLETNLSALDAAPFTEEELGEIEGILAQG